MRRGLCVVLLLCAVFARADEATEQRELRLAHQLRCLVCQNQTLAESNAPLAADMRRQIREQLAQGRSDDEIVAFFEQRYGAFVRFDPPFAPSTSALTVYEQGTLILDFADAKKRSVIWRGSASDALDRTRGEAQRDKIISDALAQMLKKFPPKQR